MLSVANSCHYDENSKNGENRLQTNARPSGATLTNPRASGATPTNPRPPSRAKARTQKPQGGGKFLAQIPGGAREDGHG